MKRLLPLLIALLVACTAPALAAHGTLSGSVQAERVQIVRAPADGEIAEMSLLPGMAVEAGQTAFTYAVTRLYAPFDATVTGLSAAAGRILKSETPLLSLEPKEKYTLSASTSFAFQSAENLLVHTGEKVFLSCVTDGSHQGYGLITAVSGADFTIVTVGGEFYTGEAVNVFRGESAEFEQRIGRATVYRAEPQAVSASGLLTRLFVREGDRVQKGEALCELIPDADCAASALSEGGIVTAVSAAAGDSVRKGSEIARLVPEYALIIACPVSEGQLAALADGQEARVIFAADALETPYEARLISLSALPENGAYEARFRLLTSPAELRIGMTAEVFF